MTVPETSTIKGLSIATIILSILGLVIAALLVAMMGVANSYIDEYPQQIVQIIQDAASSSGSSSLTVVVDGTTVNLASCTNDQLILGAKVLLATTIWVLVVFIGGASIITLIAGILGLRNAARPEKLLAAFVLSIIGAVVALVIGAIVRTILLIVAAVYIYKARKRGPAVPPTAPPSGSTLVYPETLK